MKVIKIAQLAKEPRVDSLFTGPITVQPIIGKDLSGDFLIRQVNFGRGVRTKSHSHTSEQILIVTEGKGIVAANKEEVTVSPGDAIFIPAGEKHWHGAAKGATFSHIVVSLEQKTTLLED